MSMPNAVTSGSNTQPRAAASASTSAADSADGLTLDFASLLMGLGAADELDTADTKTLKPDEGGVVSAMPGDASAQALTPVPTPAPTPDTVQTQTPDARGTEAAGAVAMGPAAAGAARAQAAAAASDATTGTEAVAGVADGRPGSGRKAATQLPNLLKQAAYTQRMNAAQGGAAEAASGSGANAGAGNARATTALATAAAAAAARGDDIAARLNPRGADALFTSPTATPLVTVTTVTAAVITPDQKLDAWGADRAPATADLGLGAAGVMGAGGAATSQSVLSVAPDGGLTTQMHVAEQVSYWVGQGVQNAEVEVRGLAENPIQVSIDLQGVEAHVAFRAEQAETRQVLQEAVPQLRELLAREGLVLSGVSVGVNSGDSQAQRQAKGQEEGRRVAQVRAAEAVAAAAPMARPRASGSTGRSVDLFV